ncbi:hypothetical protein SVAN01_11630 [Stagonosporopsis vannaccii]|nr:hypothetical protein SVAN01_11630 [Stagonosporopsis vannaccii]
MYPSLYTQFYPLCASTSHSRTAFWCRSRCGFSILAFILTIYKLTIFGEIFVALAENPTCELFTLYVSQHRTNLYAPLCPPWAPSSAWPEAKFGLSVAVAVAVAVGPPARNDATEPATEGIQHRRKMG